MLLRNGWLWRLRLSRLSFQITINEDDISMKYLQLYDTRGTVIAQIRGFAKHDSLCSCSTDPLDMYDIVSHVYNVYTFLICTGIRFYHPTL